MEQAAFESTLMRRLLVGVRNQDTINRGHQRDKELLMSADILAAVHYTRQGFSREQGSRGHYRDTGDAVQFAGNPAAHNFVTPAYV